MSGRRAGLGLAVFALVLVGAGAASFADRASEGAIDRDLLGAPAWGKPGQSVRTSIYALKAVPGGPYTVRRGGTVKLDGSASKPKNRITSYVWTFASDCPGGIQGQSSSLPGKIVKIVAVCDTTATLTVSDGQNSDTKSTKIKVTGKLPDVKFDQPEVADIRNFPFATDQGGTYVFGFNRCAIEWGESHDPDLTDHWLHKPDDGNDVETNQVSDPGGPYDGFFYVTDHNLLVTRQMIINSKLYPGGAVNELNQDTAKHRKAVENIAEATLDHERIHGELVKKALKSKKLEFLDELAKAVDLSEEALQTRADAIIVGGETEMKSASTESKVANELAKIWGNKKATILRPTDGSSKTYTLANIPDTEVGTK